MSDVSDKGEIGDKGDRGGTALVLGVAGPSAGPGWREYWPVSPTRGSIP